MEHLKIAMHCRRHQGRETDCIRQIDQCASINEPSGCLPILLRRRDQQRRPPLRVTPVWIDMFDQAQVDKRGAVDGHGSNEIGGRNGDA
jgi:hypothetical protein